MSRFDELTGTTEYQRQSWRDSFNGGRAAGDWTGNTNARLDAERRAFGTTWGGSSTQPSALELARSYGLTGERPSSGAVVAGPGGGHVATGPVTAGPGAPSRRAVGGSRLRLFADEKWAVPVNVPGPGGGDFVVTIPRADPETLLPSDKPLKRIGVGGPQESLGSISDIGWVRTATGWKVIPSSDVKERIEDDWVEEWQWQIRNRVLPDMMLVPQPYPDFLRGSEDGVFYNGFMGEWQGRQYVTRPYDRGATPGWRGGKPSR